MKTPAVVNMILTLVFLMSGWTAVDAQQNRIEVPGDHFSLEGALELFKKSASPEEFERMLNSADSKVNNLDLNGDGDIDYIRVIDRNEGNVHAFILQAVISDRESQDIAVISLEKLANGKAVLQITGDADIYGIETIIEPTEEVRINAGTSTARTVVNVWSWPSVQYVYSPYYYGWASPWSYSYRPYWWNPWRPVVYVSYYSYWEPYRPYYSVCHSHRIVYAQQIYRPYRNTSVIVYNRHYTQINNYRSTYSDSRNSRSRDYDNRQNNNSYNRDTSERQGSGETQRGNSRSSGTDWSKYNNENNRTRPSSMENESSSGNRSSREVNNAPSSWQRNSGNGQRQDAERKQDLLNTDNPTRQQPDRSTFDSKNRSERSNTPGSWQSDRSRSAGSNSDGQLPGRTNGSSETRGRQESYSQPERRSSSGNSTFGGQPANRNNGASENRSSQRTYVQPETRSSSGSTGSFGQAGNRNNGSSENRGTQRTYNQPETRSSSGNTSIQRSGSGESENKPNGQKRGRD